MSVPVSTKKQNLSFYYGDMQIAFEREPRKSGSKLLIKVQPDCRVVVSAPDSADNDAVMAAVKKRGRWIYKKLSGFRKEQEHVIPRKYVSGESHYYLGKKYVLKVVEDPKQPQCVKLLRGSLLVSIRSKKSGKVRYLLSEWYKARAKELFSQRLDAMLEQTHWVAQRPPLRVLAMKTQWGSCSPNGRITLNPALVMTPREYIDYVILHELCHIAEHNHSKRFYRLMKQMLPNWEKIKERLDRKAFIFMT